MDDTVGNLQDKEQNLNALNQNDNNDQARHNINGGSSNKNINNTVDDQGSEGESEQGEQEQEKDEIEGSNREEKLRSALLKAIINIRNCYKRKGFDNNSLNNFKKTNNLAAQAIIAECGEIDSAEEWIRNLIILCKQFQHESLEEPAREILKIDLRPKGSPPSQKAAVQGGKPKNSLLGNLGSSIVNMSKTFASPFKQATHTGITIAANVNKKQLPPRYKIPMATRQSVRYANPLNNIPPTTSAAAGNTAIDKKTTLNKPGS
jgi:hypothetical protein